MRLWSLHPKFLDPRGLVALWRESLLAQAVLLGKTKGYRHHPQLLRFQTETAAVALISDYLRAVHDESLARDYHFDAAKIIGPVGNGKLSVTRGQLDYEWMHLLAKVKVRDPGWAAKLAGVEGSIPHPLFQVVSGDVESWERFPGKATGARGAPPSG